MSTQRFALSDARGWRALRWLGRLITLAAAWPAWYACFGEPKFDQDAGLVGGIGLVLGLLLNKAGYRARNPSKLLEIDRTGGVARLREGSVAVAVSPLAELARWTLRSWVVTTRSKHGTTSTTWYAARCPGFGDQDLYVDDNEPDCRRFIQRVEAAAFPFNLEGWHISEPVVAKVMKRHGLADRDALLWAASWRDDGLRALNEQALEAAARELAETTVGAQAALWVDRGLVQLQGRPGRLLLAALTAAMGLGVYAVVAIQQSFEPGTAIAAAIGVFLLALGWRSLDRPLLAPAICAAAGAGLISKPWVAPIISDYGGVAFSPSSETHLYFVLPGVCLGVLALIFTAALRIRKG